MEPELGAAAPAPCVMIVDDTPENLRVLEGMLGGAGYRVRPFPRGRLALQAAAADPPDLVLLDVNMPDMDGYEVCRQLKRDPRCGAVPVLFLSAQAELHDKVEAFQAGGVDYVTKPFQFEEVLARVRTHLQLRRLQAELAGRVRQLEERNQRLRELEQLRDDLMHMIVHDLRTPLTGVLGYLDLFQSLRPRGEVDPRRDYVSRAQQAGAQLLSLITDLLDIGRFEAGKLPLRPTECDLNTLASEAVAALGSLTMHHEVRLDPATPRPLLSADPDILRRVVGNLLGNALKFTPRGGEVRVGIGAEASKVRLTVSDSGPGIPLELQGRIFDKFGQASLTQEQRRGSSGLGLAFCKLAVEAHGGRIGVESAPGQGSRFWVELPAPEPPVDGRT